MVKYYCDRCGAEVKWNHLYTINIIPVEDYGAAIRFYNDNGLPEGLYRDEQSVCPECMQAIYKAMCPGVKIEEREDK